MKTKRTREIEEREIEMTPPTGHDATPDELRRFAARNQKMGSGMTPAEISARFQSAEDELEDARRAYRDASADHDGGHISGHEYLKAQRRYRAAFQERERIRAAYNLKG